MNRSRRTEAAAHNHKLKLATKPVRCAINVGAIVHQVPSLNRFGKRDVVPELRAAIDRAIAEREERRT